MWVFTLGLKIWPRLAHFPRLRGAETEALDLRDRDETEALDLRDRDETETLKNSVSRLSRDRDMSRDTTALLLAPTLSSTDAIKRAQLFTVATTCNDRYLRLQFVHAVVNCYVVNS